MAPVWGHAAGGVRSISSARRVFALAPGRIERVPRKRKVRAAVLLEVVSRFEPGRVYAEPEVNEILLGVHKDFAYLRRELVNYRYLEREAGRYRTAAQAPVRSAIEHQEIPAWEADWLQGFLEGRCRGRVVP